MTTSKDLTDVHCIQQHVQGTLPNFFNLLQYRITQTSFVQYETQREEIDSFVMICLRNFCGKISPDSRAAGHPLLLFTEPTASGGSKDTVLDYIIGEFLWKASGNETRNAARNISYTLLSSTIIVL